MNFVFLLALLADSVFVKISDVDMATIAAEAERQASIVEVQKVCPVCGNCNPLFVQRDSKVTEQKCDLFQCAQGKEADTFTVCFGLNDVLTWGYWQEKEDVEK